MRFLCSASLASALLVLSTSVQAQETEPFDHIHLAVPDVAGARDWYIRHMGGETGETPESVAWDRWPGDHPLPVQLLFVAATTARPSEGTTVDHIGFSFPSVDAAVKELRVSGVTIVQDVTAEPGIGKRAVVEDPWGTKLVLLEDADVTGIHHVELRVPDPVASVEWLVRAFGGDRVKYRDVLDGVRYRDLNVFYLFVSKDDSASSTLGHVIDHIAFGPIDLDRAVAVLNTQGATFVSNPNPRINPACQFVSPASHTAPDIRRLYCAQPDPLAHRSVFVEGPAGMRVELLQHLEAGGH